MSLITVITYAIYYIQYISNDYDYICFWLLWLHVSNYYEYVSLQWLTTHLSSEVLLK